MTGWLRETRRKLTLRCHHCGHCFRWRKDPRHSFGNREVYHGPCMGYLIWHRSAEERLAVLDTVCDISGVAETTVRGLLEMRAKDEQDRLTTTNRASRVFHDLGQLRHRTNQQENP